MLVAGCATGASALAATAPSGPTLKLSLPNPIHVNKTYRITASGHIPGQVARTLAVFIQTEAHGKCRKTTDGEFRHHGYPAISPDGPVPVGPGDYKVKSDKLVDTKANGHDYVCGYLQTRDGKYVLKKHKKVQSVP